MASENWIKVSLIIMSTTCNIKLQHTPLLVRNVVVPSSGVFYLLTLYGSILLAAASHPNDGSSVFLQESGTTSWGVSARWQSLST